jgi:DNA-binding NtrC family response regulator
MDKPQKLVFLVDDDTQSLDDLNFFLNDSEILTETSNKAEEAIKRIQNGLVYDLLIVDRSMPEVISGEEVARISKLINPTIPVWGMSGYRDFYNRSLFENYFKKPFNPNLLVEQVKIRFGL